jgi:hypothetical protein
LNKGGAPRKLKHLDLDPNILSKEQDQKKKVSNFESVLKKTYWAGVKIPFGCEESSVANP